MSRDIPPLPAESNHGVWPTLAPNVARGYIGVKDAVEQLEVAGRNRQKTVRLKQWQRLRRAIPKGAIIGLLLFTLVYGLAQSVVAWWRETGITLPPLNDRAAWAALPPHLTPQPSDWIGAAPWLAVAVCFAVTLLLRVRVGLVLAALICLALAIPAIPHHLLAFIVCVVGCVILRFLYQLIPVGSTPGVKSAHR